MASKNNGQDTTVQKPLDTAFLNIKSADEIVDLSELSEPFVKIESYFDVPVIVMGYEKRPATKGKNEYYYILSVVDAETGQEFRSSCSHWFMGAYITKCEEKSKKPFPARLAFYRDGDNIKFRGVK